MSGKVIPVPPVNPATPSSQAAVRSPGVVNLVNQANKPIEGEAVYTSVSDPARRGSEAATVQKDWTITRPEQVKEQVPPPEPLSKLLLDFLHNMWRASGSVVRDSLPEHLRTIEDLTRDPSATPGDIAKQVLTYTPLKIARTEKSLSGDASSSSTTP